MAACGRIGAVRRRTAAKRDLPLGIGQLALELLALLDQRLHALDHVVGLGAQHARQLAHAAILLGQIGARALGRQRLDAAHAGRARALADDAHEADVAGARHVRAAAQLHRPGLVGLACAPPAARRCPSTRRAPRRRTSRRTAPWRRVCLASSTPIRRVSTGAVLQHERVGHRLDGRDLLGRHGLGVGEIEAQPLRVHQRALLGHVRAQHLAQRLVQEMGGGVVGARGRAARVIDDQLDRIAGLERARLDAADVHEHVAQLLLRIRDAEQRALGALDDARRRRPGRRTRHRTASG